MVCDALVSDTQTVRISDNNGKFDITGCYSCTDEVYKKIRNLKDIEKKSVDKVLKEIKFNK